MMKGPFDMRKYVIAALALAVLAPGTSAQAEPRPPDAADSAWQLSVDAGLAATQAAYSDNWTGGEAGSFNWTFTSNSMAAKKLTSVLHSTTTLKLAFGQTYTQLLLDDGSSQWQRPRKSTDLIDLESVLRFDLHKFVDPYMAVRVETQFLDASVRQLKRYFSPAKITESGGFIRVFADDPKKLQLKSRFGFALRQIATKTIIDTTAETTEWNTTKDGGLESVTDLKAALNETLSYTSKLTLYKALFFSESDTAPTDDWKTADMNWEHILSATVAKYIQVNLYFQLMYDKQIDAGVRVKETLGMGLTYKLF